MIKIIHQHLCKGMILMANYKLNIYFICLIRNLMYLCIRKNNNIMKKILLPLLVLVFAMLLNSCKTSKNFYYFDNIDSIDWASAPGMTYDARIMPKDQLTITVSTTDPQAALPFNLQVANTLSGGSSQISNGSGMLQAYLVDNDGYIEFPVIGKISVVGLTKNECQDMIKAKIAPYLSKDENPIVTVRMSSFRVTVVGEAGSKRNVAVPYEKMSIVECLAEVGDLTPYSLRDGILIIRTDKDGKRTHARLDIHDANILNHPFFYLQQNDIIYLRPNKVAVRNSAIGQSTSLYFSVISVVTSLITLTVNIIKW